MVWAHKIRFILEEAETVRRAITQDYMPAGKSRTILDGKGQNYSPVVNLATRWSTKQRQGMISNTDVV